MTDLTIRLFLLPVLSLSAHLVIACSGAGPSPATDLSSPGADLSDARALAPDASDLRSPASSVGCVVRHGAACAAASLSDSAELVSTPGIWMPGAVLWRDTQPAMTAVIQDLASPSLDVFAGTDARSMSHVATYPTPAASATGGLVGGRSTLFYVARPDAVSAPRLVRSLLEASGFSDGEPVTIRGTSAVPVWPQVFGLADGKILLAFVDPQKDAYLGVGRPEDGIDAGPIPAAQPAPLPGVLAHVGTTRDGALVLTHQIADAKYTAWRSYVQRSSDGGATWSAPARVAPEWDNVHDAFPIARADAGADLYYLRVAEDIKDLQVFRRGMREDGTFGEEQRVIDGSFGHVEKPQPRRQPDGRIALSLSRRLSAKQYNVHLLVVEGDAPPP